MLLNAPKFSCNIGGAVESAFNEGGGLSGLYLIQNSRRDSVLPNDLQHRIYEM
jgi:hypothetical protein